jgi:hypothetical protein
MAGGGRRDAAGQGKAGAAWPDRVAQERGPMRTEGMAGKARQVTERLREVGRDGAWCSEIVAGVASSGSPWLGTEGIGRLGVASREVDRLDTNGEGHGRHAIARPVPASRGKG